MNLNEQQWQEIEHVIQLGATHQVNLLEVENASYRICVQAPAGANTTNAVTFTPSETPQRATAIETENKTKHCITSTYVGRIQLGADAASPACVKVGQQIKSGDTVAYVAALGKLLPIISEQTGTVRHICVEHLQAIQYGQVLFELE